MVGFLLAGSTLKLGKTFCVKYGETQKKNLKVGKQEKTSRKQGKTHRKHTKVSFNGDFSLVSSDVTQH